MITRLLVANRAEIAARVFRTCRRLGIETVAVHSDADAELPYVAEADLAVRLPGTAAGETYLCADLLVDAALRAGADAVHPGYGFLSENADFARAVLAAGLTWVGPAPESIEQMGSKVRAKQIVRAAGVPVLEAPDRPTEADLPLLVKASAGGGGRGMRVVRDLADLDAEVERARAEAAAAFGDGTVFVEPYVERGRHVEVQVLGDRAGRIVVLGTRDCSVQRRHQKVVEEAPAPGLSAEVERGLLDAARRAAEAIGYVGAGTVELLLDPGTGRFWFLEMNTRLQVEHPVTEEVLGVDLVQLQLDVAEGRPLTLPDTVGGEPWADGHAVEVRLYAEDPARGHQPQSGVLTAFDVPAEPGIRVEAGFAAGDAVTTHYDAMLAKVVAHAPTREQAARRLAGVLRRARLHGVATNRDQLVAVLTSPAFLAGELSTGFLDEHVAARAEPDPAAPVAAALALAERAVAARTVQRGVPVAWRNVVSAPQTTTLRLHDEDVEVAWWGGRSGYTVAPTARTGDLAVVAAGPIAVTLERDGVRTTYDVAVSGPRGREVVEVDAPTGHVRLERVPRFADPSAASGRLARGSLLAPMPGSVVSVAAAVGDRVRAGQPLLVLEAMKMQHTVSAPVDGVLSVLDVVPGAQVAAGAVLAVVDPGPTDTPDEGEHR
ncbi:biotin carboxylase N-terminal domain-containing protein [Nocardioides sp. zg-DK7169]|uniref:ATP-binding protein n=1 Tax=Nocardioides sp. zg-DK7169 TaxID=2736600 RepID=UPI001553F645|nr:biotin carboxylase N-terminal domain-containing protein [Nocardioides sp. zg-DK7169]NPC97156.1 ATP-grasp domain-containing protein [Nocardioides sp. zg-DK7169]